MGHVVWQPTFLDKVQPHRWVEYVSSDEYEAPGDRGMGGSPRLGDNVNPMSGGHLICH